jgi:hypothetical protein
MKVIEVIATMGLATIKMGIRVAKSGGGAEIAYGVVFLKKAWLNAAADTDAIEIGAIALTDKCLRTASWAKTMPARGAPKPAEVNQGSVLSD